MPEHAQQLDIHNLIYIRDSVMQRVSGSQLPHSKKVLWKLNFTHL